jgi:hypothetical protein
MSRLITHKRIHLLHHIAPKLSSKTLATEARLTTTKWFDYRFINPVTATQIFADAYWNQCCRPWSACIDGREAGETGRISMGDIFATSYELAGLWRARQTADEYGIPYNFFVQQVIEICKHERCTLLPRPHQLLDPQTVKAVALAWVGHARSLIRFSKLPQYRNEAFCDHPLQRAHHDWLIYLIRQQRSSASIIGQLCFIDKVLTVERATLEFGEDKLNKARKCFVGAAEPYSVNIFLDLHPACFAVPHAYQPNGEVCIACPKRESCRRMEGEIRAEIAYRHGTDDPAGDHARDAAAAWVRRYREKKMPTMLKKKV